VIGTDVQNTTRPDLKAAKAAPASAKRELLKQLVMNRMKKTYGS
jgi:hypothetical protein